MRQVVNAVLYVLRSSCAWRMLSRDFPPWQTAYGYFNSWRREGIWEAMNGALREAGRQETGRGTEPSAAVVDSQSVKTAEVKSGRGYDSNKKAKGRKRHIMVDVTGLLLVLVVHKASIQERPGAKLLLQHAVPKELECLDLVWACGGYSGRPTIDWVWQFTDWVFKVVKRGVEATGHVVLPRRWVVERMFAWLGRYRRLSKDYEQLPETSEAMIYAAMAHITVRRRALDLPYLSRLRILRMNMSFKTRSKA